MSTPKPAIGSKNAAYLNLSYVIKHTQHMLRLQMDDALRPLGLTTPQYAALSSIAATPGISNAALARTSFVTAQTMISIVRNLETAGLLSRSADPNHGRILCSNLTKQGRARLNKAQHIIQELEQKMMQSFSQAEVIQFKNLLSACVKNLSS